MRKTKPANMELWTLVWTVGIAGQLCWNIENQWFNTFIYAKIAKDSSVVTLMVITSAIVTTVSTFFFGTLSDRKGTRRRFVAIGYIAWGVCTIGFGMTEFITSGTVGTNAKLTMLAVVLVILADNVMSFFGSMGNDSGYNVWTNDMTTDLNRGQMGAALATQPVIGTIVGTVLGGMLIGANDNYQRLFWVMGLFVIAVGIISLFRLRDAESLRPHIDGSFWHQFKEIFNFKTFFDNKELAITSLTATLFFIPFNIYFVHMGNWMIYRMGFTADSMGLLQGAGLLLAMLLTVPAIFLINKNKTPIVAFCAVALNFAGLMLLYFKIKPGSVDTVNVFAMQNMTLLFAVFLSGAGYVLLTQSMTMWTKQLFPQNNKGQFEGVRIMFFTLVPMVIGTLIGNVIIKNGAGTVTNQFGIVENIPTETIFFWAALLVLLALIPLYFASHMYNARLKNTVKIGGK